MNQAVQYAIKLLDMLPQLLAAGMSIGQATQIISAGRQRLQAMEAAGRGPTQQEWDELDRHVADLRGQLHGGSNT